MTADIPPRPSRSSTRRPVAGHPVAGHRHQDRPAGPPAPGPEHAGPPAPPGWYDPRAPRPRNTLGVVALVLAVAALVVGPVVHLVVDAIMVPGWGVLCVLLGVPALVLALIGLRRVRRHVATNRRQALTAAWLAGLSLVVLVVQGTAAGMEYNRDAASVCQALSPSWDGGPTGDPLTAGSQAISRATPGQPAAYQLERAGLMVAEQCPDRLRSFRIFERMSARASGY